MHVKVVVLIIGCLLLSGESWPADRPVSPYRYYFGHGVPQDYARAYEIARELAESRDVISWFVLGKLYENGQAVGKDMDEAMRWYRQAAERGLVLAQFRLAAIYLGGDGIGRNVGEAIKWLRLAAADDYMHAQYALGMIHRIGDGTERDEAQARKWFRRAANQGHLQAVFAIKDGSFTDGQYIKDASSAIPVGDMKILFATEKGRNYKPPKILLYIAIAILIFLEIKSKHKYIFTIKPILLTWQRKRKDCSPPPERPP
jgi:TPR repeat protein